MGLVTAAALAGACDPSGLPLLEPPDLAVAVDAVADVGVSDLARADLSSVPPDLLVTDMAAPVDLVPLDKTDGCAEARWTVDGVAGTVVDNRTGLTWQQGDSGGAIPRE